MDKILLDIFGKDAGKLSKKQIAIAEKVAEHFLISENGERYGSDDVLAACRYAVKCEGMEWDSVMLAKCRERDILELRYCIFTIFCSRVNTTQSKQAEMLGGVFDRVTVRHATMMAEEWKSVDANFRNKFARISQRVEEHLKTTMK